jgi:DUF1009 family protein
VNSTSSSPLGLIAGNGTFPRLLAEAARRRGARVVAVALKEEADPALEKSVDEITWHSLGQFAKTINFFKTHGVRQAVMAGQVKHTQLFKNIVPDWRASKLLARLANQKAASILSAITEEFKSEGIEFMPSTLYLEDWLCPLGSLARRRPSKAEQADMAFGIPLARDLAALDVGQTLVVKDRTVVAVEAMEGTDACIRRASQVAGPGGVILKVARPKQDFRFDVPIVGEATLRTMQEAGASVLALEAGKTLLLEKEHLVELANAADLSIEGVAV